MVLGGGPIGQLIALVAMHIGAEVLVSEISEIRRNFAESLGVESIDPTKEDLESRVQSWTGPAAKAPTWCSKFPGSSRRLMP